MFAPEAMTAVIVTEKNKPLKLAQTLIPTPAPDDLLIKVLACGICHSDLLVINGPIPIPRIPGHEIIGEVLKVGKDVKGFKVGDRVGGSWHGAHPQPCSQPLCPPGLPQCCPAAQINGITRDGGYTTHTLLSSTAAVHIPSGISAVQAAPLLCAGVTVFNSLRKTNTEQGSLVAVQGLGGLGHLAVQYANKMGYTVAALSRGSDKKAFAKELGATYYIDSESQDVGAELMKLGGATVIMVTAPITDMRPLQAGLAVQGTILSLAVAPETKIDGLLLVSKAARIQGWPSGYAKDCKDAIAFADKYGVKALIEEFSLKDVNEGIKRMEEGKVRFRGVLNMEL